MPQKRFSVLVALLISAMLLAACPQPIPIVPGEQPATTDQPTSEEATEVAEEEEVAEATRGGVFTQGSSADASILNPILSTDSASSNVHQFFFPTLIGQDPWSGEFIPSQLAESWEVSDDGLVWTFTLRDDVFWSDGEQVDSSDFKYTYEAIASDNVETPRKSNVELISSIETPDPQTVVVTFSEVKCDGLGDLGLGILPSHLFAEDFSDIMENEFNQGPTVSGGPFVFNEWVRDDHISTTRNEDYFLGAPYMDGWIMKIVPDAGARLAQLQTGELDQVALQPEQITTAELDPNVFIDRFEDDGYDYIGLNLANPENPQPGLDEEGNTIEQDPHPILGDLNVRKAIAHALDYDTIIENVYLGQGYQIPANVLPAIQWAYNDALQPYEYNTDLAQQLLEEAGWIDQDGDGVRECAGCATAEEGTVLELTLITNAGNTTREDLGTLVQDQLTNIGFALNFEAIDFGTVVEQILAQTYDMVIIGWTGTGADPNDDGFWRRQYDTPGSGFNFVSFSNERVDELLQQGLTVPGCDPDERAPYYKEIQEIIYEQVPYVFISGGVGNRGFRTRWQGIDPGPWTFYYNIEQWSLRP